jgi:uncharacterized protein (TIGR03000 family)
LAHAQYGLPNPYPPRPYPDPYYPPYQLYVPFPIFQNQNQPPTQAPAPQRLDQLPAPQDNRARITIVLPSTANDIWVEGEKMPSRLTATRIFISPPLEPGHDYSYRIKASWVNLDQIITRERQVMVRANQSTTVDFTRPAPTPINVLPTPAAR